MSKRQQSKNRTELIYAATRGEVSELSITVDPATGEFSFGNEMTNVYTEVNYDRSKKPKVVSRIPQNDARLTFDAHAALKKNFDFICAVDTNTKAINGKKVSVVGIVTVKPVSLPGPKGIQTFWQFDVPCCIEYIELKPPVENFGWMSALDLLFRRGYTNKTKKIGMIVDSDLGRINDFNQRNTPVYGPVLLPENVQLIYASADTGMDLLVNKSLSVADSVASQVITALEKGEAPFNVKRVRSDFFEGWRIVNPRKTTLTAPLPVVG